MKLNLDPSTRSTLKVLAALAIVFLVALLVGGCVSKPHPAPSLARAQESARAQHAAFTAAERALEQQANALARTRSHAQEAALRARQIDAKAQIILQHW